MDLLTHYLEIVLLGVIEGVTEFLPISSTGHLLIAESLGLGHEPDVFNVVIQAGAILAVVFIYLPTLLDLLGSLDRPDARSYLLKIGGAFIVTAVVSLVLVKICHLKLPETLEPVAWATLIGGFVIFLVEFLSKSLYPHEDVSWLEAVAIGLAQVVAAAFPGASRSGATIMTGLAFGMKRTTATQFSFLLGIPTMFAASALDLWRYRKDLTGHDHQLLIDVTIGFFVSLVVAFFVVKWLLTFVRSHTFNGFAIYRVLLGGALLLALATHALPNVGPTPESRPSEAEKPPLPAPPAPAPVALPLAPTNVDTAPPVVPAPAAPAEPAPTAAPAPADPNSASTAPANPASDAMGVPVPPATPPAPDAVTNAAP